MKLQKLFRKYFPVIKEIFFKVGVDSVPLIVTCIGMLIYPLSEDFNFYEIWMKRGDIIWLGILYIIEYYRMMYTLYFGKTKISYLKSKRNNDDNKKDDKSSIVVNLKRIMISVFISFIIVYFAIYVIVYFGNTENDFKAITYIMSVLFCIICCLYIIMVFLKNMIFGLNEVKK